MAQYMQTKRINTETENPEPQAQHNPSIPPEHTVTQEEEIRQWETASGWVYVGHGEWAPPEEIHKEQNNTREENKDTPDRDPAWVYKWQCTVDEDIRRSRRGVTLTDGPGGQYPPSGTWKCLRNAWKATRT